MPSGKGDKHTAHKRAISRKDKIKNPKNIKDPKSMPPAKAAAKVLLSRNNKLTKNIKSHANAHLHKRKTAPSKAHQTKKKVMHADPNSDFRGVIPKSINEALILDILKNHNAETASSESVLLAQMLSGFTKSMRKLSYMAGISNGMFLYRFDKLQKRYIWYQDSIRDLSEFFEKAGYRSSSYDIFPDKVVIKLYGAGPNFGTDIHVFESGIISGFLTAAIGHYVPVNEEECMHAGARYCRFSTSNARAAESIDSDHLRHINALARHITSDKSAAKSGKFSKSYLNLIYQVITEREYLGSMKDLLGYFGKTILQMSDGGRHKKIKDKDLTALAQQNINLLNLGRLNTKGANAAGTELVFDPSQSRSEFVELAVAFLNGVFGKDMAGDAKLKSENNIYSISINKKNK